MDVDEETDAPILTLTLSGATVADCAESGIQAMAAFYDDDNALAGVWMGEVPLRAGKVILTFPDKAVPDWDTYKVFPLKNGLWQPLYEAFDPMK